MKGQRKLKMKRNIKKKGKNRKLIQKKKEKIKLENKI